MWRRVSCWAALCFVLPAAARADTDTLQQAWIDAYRLNPSLQAERAKLRSTDELVSQAQSHWRPSIDATATIGKTYQYLPAQTAAGLDPNYSGTSRSYGVQVTQPLFRGFRTNSETEAAENQVLSGRAKLEDAEQQLFIDTATAFFDLIRDQAVLASNRDNERVLEKKLEETRTRAKFGDLTQTDVRQAESRLARAHVARYQAETAVTADRANYQRLVGKAPEKLARPDLPFVPPKEDEDLLRQAEIRNPKVIAAKFDIEEARAEVDLTKGSLLPEINLVGNHSQNWRQGISTPGQQDSSQVLIQATMPLYRADTDYSRARAAEQTVTQRSMQLDEARHRAREVAQNALQAYLSAQAAVEADKDGVRAATQALEGVREEAKIGTRTTLDVLNAEQELLDAKTDQAKAQHDRDLAVLQIQAATGTLTADNLKLPLDRYDPAQHYDDVRNQWIGFSADDQRYLIVPPQAAADLAAAPSSEPSQKMTSEDVVPQKDIPPAVLAATVLPVTHEPLEAADSVKPYNFNKKIPAEETLSEIASSPMNEAAHEEVAHQAVPMQAEPVQASRHTAVFYNFNKKPQQEQTPDDAAPRQDTPPVETSL
jgi:TolC family type I secretion outer membrane protein